MTNQKTCPRCSRHLPLSGFYKRPKLTAGYTRECRDCLLERERVRRENNHAEFLARDRKAHLKHREKRREYNKHWRQDNPEKVKVQRQRFYQKWHKTERYEARRLLKTAVKDGRIVKPQVCENCFGTFPKQKLHGHHANYTKPFEVSWLCGPCHNETHAKYTKIAALEAHT